MDRPDTSRPEVVFVKFCKMFLGSRVLAEALSEPNAAKLIRHLWPIFNKLFAAGNVPCFDDNKRLVGFVRICGVSIENRRLRGEIFSIEWVRVLFLLPVITCCSFRPLATRAPGR